MGIKKYFLLFLCTLFLGCLFLFFNEKSQTADPKTCPFCNIDVLKSQAFYEDEHVIALYTHKPACKGHCLIIPKSHQTRFESLSEKEVAHIGACIKKVHFAASKVFKTSSYLLLQKNGGEVGQSISHLHIHYLPRKKGAQFQLFFFFKILVAHVFPKISEAKMEKYTFEMKEAIKNES